MPHLSPMNWLAALLSMTLMLLLYSSCTWWGHKSKFTSISSHETRPGNWTWKW